VTQKVIDPNTGVESVVSDSAVRNAVESERPVYRMTRDGPTKVKIFDVIDKTWLGPIAPNLAYQDYLLKVVFKCSACNFTTPRENQVAEHIRAVFNGQSIHADATLETVIDNGIAWQFCSGCGGKFRAGKRAGNKHLEAVQGAPVVHVGASELMMKRFALEPSEPMIMKRTPVHSGEVLSVVEPEAKVMRSSRRRHRSRRGRNKGDVSFQ